MYRIAYKDIGGIVSAGDVIKLTKAKAGCLYCSKKCSLYKITKCYPGDNNFVCRYTCDTFLSRYPTLINTLWVNKITKTKIKIIDDEMHRYHKSMKAILYLKDERCYFNCYVAGLSRKEWNYQKLST